MQEPRTTATWRRPWAERTAWLRKMRPKWSLIGKDLALQRQEGAAGIDQVEAGQAVGEGDLLGAEVLLDRHREVGAALDGRVVGDDDDLPPADPADPGDDAGAGAGAVVHPLGGQRRELQEGRGGIEDALDPLAHRQFAARPLSR